MLIRSLMLTAAATTASACATADQLQTDCDDSLCVGINETFTSADFSLTPLEVLEDSRCPVEAECVWTGQVRIRASVERDGRTEVVELSNIEPVEVLSGTLTFTHVWPEASVERPIEDQQQFRFAFDFAPHLMDRLY